MAEMQIELRSSLRKFFSALVCFVLMGLYLQWSLRAYLASRLAAVPEPSKLQKAIRLEPSNAEYRDLFGRYSALSGTSLDEGIANFRAAVQLNPYVAQYWLDLAGAYQISGRIQEQGKSVERAVQADPTTPDVAWAAANFFLVQGDQERALRNFRVVLANDPNPAAIDSALRICWRATGDANQLLDQALPKTSELYLSFLNLLVSRQEAVAAETVWNRLIGLHQVFPPKLALPYFQLLIAKQEVTAAKTAWQQLSSVNASMQPYLPSSENLVINGGFEENLLNGGFDWWYQSYANAALAIDTSEFHSGTRSLAVTFDGHSVPEVRLAQFILVKPNTAYEFSAESRTVDIDTASGPRFALLDAYTNFSYVLTDDTLGTTPWRRQQARFRTGPNTNLLALKIVRDPPAPLIRGKLWIDDVKLVEIAN